MLANVDPYAHVPHGPAYGTPCKRGVEARAPRVGGIYDGGVLPFACEVLSAYIYGEVLEPPCDLSTELLVWLEARLPQRCAVGGCGRSGHESATA